MIIMINKGAATTVIEPAELFGEVVHCTGELEAVHSLLQSMHSVPLHSARESALCNCSIGSLGS